MTAYEMRNKFLTLRERAESITAEHNWYERKVHPYSYPVAIREILTECKNYDNCTSGSKVYLYQLIKGLVEILDEWDRHYKSRKMVRVNGKVKNLSPEYIEMLIEDGIKVEYI